MFVAVDTDVLAADPDVEREDLAVEMPGLLSGMGPSLAFGGEGILIRAADPPFLGHVFRGDAHDPVAEGIGENALQVIDKREVAHLGAEPGRPRDMRRKAHGLGAARHRDLAVTQSDGLAGGDDRLHPASAETVHGQRRGRFRDATVDGCDAGELGVLGAGRDDLSHDHVTDGRRINLTAGHGLADDSGAEGGGRLLRQRAAEDADGGAHTACKEEILGHLVLSVPDRGQAVGDKGSQRRLHDIANQERQ